ncbi:MAG: TMEM175 family protein [Hyphomicrobiales bacterium]
MGKGRLEAFSDGVLAIIITIMVLELKAPHGAGLADLLELTPVFLSYVLSFVYVGIYWNNHHHLLHAVKQVSAGIMWANLHLLFWLSLLPFSTAWMDENHFEQWPVFVYCLNLLMAAIAYFVLQNRIVAIQGDQSHLAMALGRDTKGKLSPLLYVAAMAMSFVQPFLSVGIAAAVALMWLIPDRRLETTLGR